MNSTVPPLANAHASNTAATAAQELAKFNLLPETATIVKHLLLQQFLKGVKFGMTAEANRRRANDNKRKDKEFGV